MKNLELDQRKKIDTQRFRDRSNIVTIVPASIIELIEGENQVINSIKTTTSSNLKCYYTAVLLIIIQLLLLIVEILFLPKRMKLKIVLMFAQFAYTTNKYSRSLEKN